MSRFYLLSYLLMFCLLGCGDQKIDTTKAREEMEAREPKKVSDAQILDQAMKVGNEIAQSFKVTESDKGLVFSLAERANLKTGYYLFGEANDLNGKAKQLFEAYEYNRNNNLKSEANVQPLDEGKTLLYTQPIIYNDSTLGMWSILFSRKEIVLSIKN